MTDRTLVDETVIFILTIATVALGVAGFVLFRRKDRRGAAVLIGETTTVIGLLIVFSSRLLGPPRMDVRLGATIRDSAPVLAAAGLGVVVVIAGFLLLGGLRAARIPTGFLIAFAVFGIGGVVAASVVCDCPARTSLDRAGASLPRGFQLEELLPPGRLGVSTAMTLTPDGELFVGTASGIVRIDLSSDEPRIETFVQGIRSPLGLVYADGWLYAAPTGRIVRLRDTGSGAAVGEAETLADGLPAYVFNVHANNGLAFGPDGLLYAAVGGTSDAGPETHLWGGTVLVLDPHEPGDEPRIFARGLRNTYDLAFCRGGELFGGDNAPGTFPGSPDAAPNDELNHIKGGAHYGYPDQFGFPPPWSDTEAPAMLLPRHSVPTGIVCYPSDGSFPERYSDSLFLATFGQSREGVPARVVNITLDEEEGYVVGEWSDFLGGVSQPVDLVVDTDGSLLVLEYETGQLLRVNYRGG